MDINIPRVRQSVDLFTHRDDPCLLERDRVAVELNDHSVDARDSRPGRARGLLYVHLEAIHFRTRTGARQQVGAVALEIVVDTVECCIMRVSMRCAFFCGCQTK